MKTIMYVAYRCLQNDEKIFEKSKTKIRNNILKFYKDLAPPSYFSIKFNIKLFNFDQRFLTMMKASTFSAIEDAIVNHRI